MKSATFTIQAAQHHPETVLNHADYPQARRLEIVRNIIAGYANVFICLDDGRGNILFQSPDGRISAIC